MTFDQMRYFVAAANFQHVGRAAVSVSISPSAVSLAISSVEIEMQTKLFSKKGRNIVLTRDGERLLSECRKILSSVDSLKVQLLNSPQTLRGRYRIAGSHFLSSRQLARGWNELTRVHEELKAEVYSMGTSHAISEVLSGKLDLALCFSPLNHPDLSETRVHQGLLRVCVKKNHPITKKAVKEKVRFLSETPAVIHKQSHGVESCEIHPLFDAMGFQPKIQTYFDNDDMAVQQLTNSNTWSFLPDIVIQDFADKVEVLPLPANYQQASYHISAVIHQAKNADPALYELTAALKRQFKKTERSPSKH
jgi:DNA-binding transcriptional LysR family regulator